jgi:signal transduction histidine kinase
MALRTSNWSLQRHLALIAAGSLAVSVLVGGGAMYWAASVENDQMLDARLEQMGAAVAALAEHRMDQEGLGVHGSDQIDSIPPITTRTSAALLYRYQVWSRNGRLLVRSNEAPAAAPIVALRRFGFTDLVIDGRQHRVFALPVREGEFVVQIAEDLGERWVEIGEITAYYAAFLLIPFGLVVGVSWLLLRRSFRAVDSIAEQLGQRNPRDLMPLDVVDPPREVLPVLESTDILFGRVGRALSVERRFTSMAAHELRTPLAGLQAQAQVAATARDGGELRDALNAMRKGVDRASYLLDQLLALARVDALADEGAVEFAAVNLAAVCDEVMAELRPLADGKRITVTARFTAERVWGHRFALAVLMHNLLVNAVVHGREGGRVEVHSEPLDEAVELTVDDDGPGIPAGDRDRAFDRFHRGKSASAGGAGLGLSIASSVAELHRATIELLDSPLDGLRVRVVFPAASGAAGAAARKSA